MLLVADDDRVMGTLVFGSIGAAIVYLMGLEAALVAAGKLVGAAAAVALAFTAIATVVGLVTIWVFPRIEDKKEAVRSAK